MPFTKPCVFCESVGFVRAENIIHKGQSYRSFYCGFCNRNWSETEDGKRIEVEADTPPDHSRSVFGEGIVRPPRKR